MEVNLNTNSLDYKKIQERLNELSKKYLPIIYEEYGKYMSSEQLQLLYTLLTSDCIKVEQDGENYLQNQKIEIINSSMSEEDKNEKLKELDIPFAHGGRVFNDNIIHF